MKMDENKHFMVWDQRVAGSNPATPTKEKPWPLSGGQGFVFTSVENPAFISAGKTKP